ncbi:phosphomethylpyrimidine synthase ThiC, partial [Aduncisulcus paluster]
MREIELADTTDKDGNILKNLPVTVYDTSGPYTDDKALVDLEKGLPKLRKEWILDRKDVEELEGLSSDYGRMRQADTDLDHLRFDHVNTQPLKAKEGKYVSQYYYAKKGIVTPEME